VPFAVPEIRQAAAGPSSIWLCITPYSGSARRAARTLHIPRPRKQGAVRESWRAFYEVMVDLVRELRSGTAGRR